MKEVCIVSRCYTDDFKMLVWGVGYRNAICQVIS